MPVLTIHVRRVDERWVRKGYTGRVRKFDVFDVDGQVYETWDAWCASLCDRYRQSGQPVKIWTRDTRYGPEIVKAEAA